MSFSEIPLEAIGLYTYLTDKVGVGLKQMMAGARKWKLDLLDRNDLMSLSERATKVTGIPTADEVEKGAIEKNPRITTLFPFFLFSVSKSFSQIRDLCEQPSQL